MASASPQNPALRSRLSHIIHDRSKEAHMKRTDTWRPLRVRGSIGPGEPHSQKNSTLSPLSHVILEFYSSINDKNLDKLEQLISDECVFEDLAYYKPLRGKRIHRFFKQLTGAMGKNVRIVIDGVYEGKDQNVAVAWHLEWNNKFIPFTKACSFYECSRRREEMIIKEARVIVESPMKPGDLALEMLKIIVSLFDKFPKLAESFLQKPDAIVHWLTKLYKMFVEPLILPFIVYYTHVWTYVTRGLSYLLRILQIILKLFK